MTEIEWKTNVHHINTIGEVQINVVPYLNWLKPTKIDRFPAIWTSKQAKAFHDHRLKQIHNLRGHLTVFFKGRIPPKENEFIRVNELYHETKLENL